MHVSEQREKPLWLELRHGRRTYVFEFAVDDERRAVVVGSLADADVRIDHAGSAPLCFHFERERDAVLIVPAYSADLRMNATPLGSPAPVPPRALIEFSNVRLEARVFRGAPQALGSELHTGPSSIRHDARAREKGVVDEFQPTRAIQAPPIAAAATTTSAVFSTDLEVATHLSPFYVGSSGDLPFARLEDRHLLDQATEVLLFMPFELEAFEVPTARVGPATTGASPPFSAQVTQAGGSPMHSFEEMTPNVVIRPIGQIELTEPCPAQPVSMKSTRAGSAEARAAWRQQTTVLEFVEPAGSKWHEAAGYDLATEPPEVPTWRRARFAWFEKLGLLAKKRPVFVGVAAVACGLSIAWGLRLLTTFAVDK